MHVVVTGGTGYLGSAIVRALARHGHFAVIFARHASSASLPGRAVDGDVRDRTALTRAAAGADAICHAAALVSVWRPRPAEFDEIGEEYLLGGDNAPQMRVFEIVRELTGAPLPRRLPLR
jgi:nucleoside-diphosphate-sugar epimerase